MARVKRESGENPGQTALLCVPAENRCMPAAVSLRNHSEGKAWEGTDRNGGWNESEDLPNRNEKPG